jgi:hypothetical protein
MKSTQADYAPRPRAICWSCASYCKRRYRLMTSAGAQIVCQSCRQGCCKHLPTISKER